MRSTLYSIALLLLCSFVARSQGETKNWYFGVFAGVSFPSTGPVALTNGSLYTTEGCSSISDTAGNLLFYTDGITVYNSNHVAMPNGSGLLGDVSTTQSALIVKKPNSNSLYYIFTLAADGGPDGMRYSIVDMTLQGGLGDVTSTKNVFLMNHLTEKLCAVNTSNNEGVWVMVHGFGDNKFYAYLLDQTGLNTTPVMTAIGTVHDSTSIQNAYGYMKFSPNGHKIACAIGYQDKVELFDFNNLDAGMANPITFSYSDHCYGVEFSPQSKYLYITRYNIAAQTFWLDQYNLLAGNPAAINASQYTVQAVYDPDELRALQLARNGKIYIARSNAGFLDVINAPDSLGAACGYSAAAVSLNGNSCMLGLPNFNASFFKPTQAPVAYFSSSDSSICAGSCISYTDISDNTPTSWQWSFQGGNPATSTAQNPGPICYSSSGSYTVSLISSNNLGSDTIVMTSFITVVPTPATPTISVSGGVLTSSPASSYQWYLNNNAIPGAVNQSYTALNSGNYSVVTTGSNGCSATSAITYFVVAGIRDVTKNDLKTYPVPATGFCYISNSGIREIKTSVLIDQLGREVPARLSKENDKWRLQLSGIAPGFYYLSISDKDGKSYKGKLIVR
jgi:PKD repeat protein